MTDLNATASPSSPQDGPVACSAVLEAGRYVAGQRPDFKALMAQLRAMRTPCVACQVGLDYEETGIRVRLADNGKQEQVCRSCFLGELVDHLLVDMPR